MGKSVARISEGALVSLERYAWPGNVRELENVLERAVALETTGEIQPERLPDGMRQPGSSASAPLIGPGFDLDAHLRTVEAQLLGEALERAGGDRGEAAKLLGVSPRSLRYLVQKHGDAIRRPAMAKK